MIASQSYIKVIRKMEWNRQLFEEVELRIELYEDKIVTGANSFRLQDVFDVSFKYSDASYGFLYLHTNQGVFPYTVKNVPHDFIFHYQETRKLWKC
ncbi:hypothetical protein GJU40_01140 [Bacillus lacus]|uniref:Uncharacterized protein n=1 Tax=Metabacillus lacus TaxID=1983721 RepID=A0A7X2IVX3_9BACI|nr:hypothetical protein [Metabacillus lacus]MRX70771.1 hypothetical protein [Metabacillus lacus]